MSTADRGYRLLRDLDLTRRNSFGVAARAALALRIGHRADVAEALADAAVGDRPLLVLGGGSNMLFTGEIDCVVVELPARGISVEDDGRVRALAAEPWDALVRHTLSLGLQGLENLSLIPGTVGAAPIQNIGAYGVEVAEVIECVEAFDRRRGESVQLDREACAFGYRDSIFKREPARFLVTEVVFRLSRSGTPRTDYAGLREELEAHDGDAGSPADVAAAVVRLRQRKLPDPARIGNAGSFFKNPLVPASKAAALQQRFDGLPVFPAAGGQAKLSAAWMIDHLGWRGVRRGDAGVSDRHALVLVNHGSASGLQILRLAEEIARSVQEVFGVMLEPEPQIVGAGFDPERTAG